MPRATGPDPVAAVWGVRDPIVQLYVDDRYNFGDETPNEERSDSSGSEAAGVTDITFTVEGTPL